MIGSPTALISSAIKDCYSKQLEIVLTAAAQAKGNQQRFLEAGLIDSSLQLVANWQAAFSRLRPLEKESVRQNPGDFLVNADDVVYRGRTSGSSGESFTYFAGKQWNRQRIIGRSQQMSEWGLSPDVPMLNLASRLSPVREQDVSLIGPIDTDFLKKLQAAVWRNPVILRGYPSRLSEVAAAIHHAQTLWDFGNVVAVIATGECLFEFQKSLLKETFKAPVINEYGCPEAGISGLSCPEEERLHLDSDRALYETLNGKLVVTDLYNTTMPMVRYCNGDRLQIETTPCACGRPGLTAQVLGRQEEAIEIDHKNGRTLLRWPGEVDLPSFPCILSYQVQISPHQQRLWIQPETIHQPPNLEPVERWLSGICSTDKATTIVLESPDVLPGKEQLGNVLTASNSATWVQQVQQSAWTTWLSQPLPIGKAEAIARLLKQLAVPRYVVTNGLPTHTQEQVRFLLKSNTPQEWHSHRATNTSVEALKIRTLLWAISVQSTQPAQADGLEQDYLTLFDRSRQWATIASEREREESAAIAIDLLAPLLVLSTATAKRLWPQVQTFIQQTWQKKLRADRFTLHHYLAILAIAGQHAQKRAHPWIPTLKPIAAIVIGDFQLLARLGPEAITLSQIALWADILHGQPDTFTSMISDDHANAGENPFYTTWRTGRQCLLKRDDSAFGQTLDLLFDLAQTPQQTAQCWLEKGYGLLLSGQTLAPAEWTEILQTHMTSLFTSIATSDWHAGQKTNPLPWLPILKALAPQLIAVGQFRLAYACLFAAAAPDRNRALFDRYCPSVNSKQSVISYRRAKE